MTITRFCDGISRRSLLKVGTAGLFGSGLALPALLQRQAQAKEHGIDAAKDERSVIILFLKGGMSTIDTFDLKPEAPAEIRGEFDPIDTSVPGIQIGEHLPRLAKEMNKLSLIRSFAHKNSDHGPADHYMLTGYFPAAGFNPSVSPNNQRPAHGAVIARKLGPRGKFASGGAVPPYICLPKMHASAGSAYLGPAAAPFVIEADPNSPGFSVPDLAPPLELEADRLDARRELLARVDKLQRAKEQGSARPSAIDANADARDLSVFRQRAFELMTSPEAKQAFDIAAEPEKLRDEYGRTALGQSCLMARRLVEAGVRCVTIDHTNWDTHDNNFQVLKTQLLPSLDAGLSTLLRDLAERGTLAKTLVVVTGEFGRTPRINKNAGRDHWGPSFTVAVAGGGTQGGRVVGASSANSERPATEPYGPEDLAATMYHLLGIDPDDEFYTPEGRPVKIANDGRVMRELL
ncbi:MAG: DUF1501 domain-containing protein [Planctomycetia bacterium]|nr:DUF1501 domain-containing protein [Planctomycetia bacterium]